MALVAIPWMFPKDFDIVLQGGLVTALFKSSLDGYNGQLSRELIGQQGVETLRF